MTDKAKEWKSAGILYDIVISLGNNQCSSIKKQYRVYYKAEQLQVDIS